MLVQVEQAQTNPSIATLCKLANALGIALLALVEVARRAGGAAGHCAATSPGCGADDRRRAPAGWSPASRRRCRSSSGSGASAPRDGYDAIAHPAGTREFVYVLEGDAAVTVDGVEVVVAAGECAVFQADRPHRYAAARGRATRFVMVVIEPIEPPARLAPAREPPPIARASGASAA